MSKRIKKPVLREHPGQPTKLTPEIQKQIIDAFRAGALVNTACDLVGIARETFYAWLDRGESEVSGVYREFSDTIKRVRSECQIEALKTIRSGSIGWQGEAWFLERSFPKQYGRRSAE